MGKSKTKKRKVRKPCPTGLPSLRDLGQDDELSPAGNARFVQTTLEKLQSTSEDEKECAASTLAGLVNQPKCIATLLQYNVVKIAGPLLVDKHIAVRLAVAGALRNLSVNGGYDVCETMVDHDIMTPLVALLKEYDHDWAPATSSSKKSDPRTEVFVQAVHLLWNLCESCNTSVCIFNQNDLLPILIRCLSITTHGLEISTVVAHCLHTVSEDNEQAARLLSKKSNLESVVALLSLSGNEPSTLLLRLLAAGIVLNVAGRELCDISGVSTSTVVGILSLGLEGAVQPLLQAFADQVTSAKSKEDAKEQAAGDCRQESSIEETSCKVKELLTIKQLALETLTNMCCAYDDAEDWDDMNSSSSSSDDALAEVDMEEGGTPVAEMGCCLASDVHEAVVYHRLVQRVKEHAVFPDEELCLVLKAHPEGLSTLKRLHTVVCRALHCIHNLAQALDVEELGGSAGVYQIWIHLANLTYKQIDLQDVSLLEASTSAARGMLQKLAGTRCFELLRSTSAGDVQVLFRAAQHCDDARVKVNVVQTAGILGSILGKLQDNGLCDIIRMIGIFLLEVATRESELWVMAEALDAIFDVFAEDHLEGVAQQIALLNGLKCALPIFRGKINQQRKHLGEHRAIIMTAKMNLVRFIKYKSGHAQNGKD